MSLRVVFRPQCRKSRASHDLARSREDAMQWYASSKAGSSMRSTDQARLV